MADVVVISPHMDDEALGCGGILALARDPLVIFGCESRDRGIEVDQAAATLSYRYITLYGMECEARMLQLDRRELVERVERVLHEEMPKKVLIPSPSYHQDHVVMFEAGLAATRPLSRQGYIAAIVAAYEYPGSAWGHNGREIELNYYVDISSAMDTKLAAVDCYRASQAGRAIADRDLVEGWARLRGSFIGAEYAEAFRLLRLTETP